MNVKYIMTILVTSSLHKLTKIDNMCDTPRAQAPFCDDYSVLFCVHSNTCVTWNTMGGGAANLSTLQPSKTLLATANLNVRCP